MRHCVTQLSGLLIYVSVLVADPAEVLAQSRRTAYAPSVSPPSSQMLRRFGRVGGWLDPYEVAASSRRQPMTRSDVAPMPQTTPRASGSGYPYGSGYSSGNRARAAGGAETGAGAIMGGQFGMSRSLIGPSSMLGRARRDPYTYQAPYSRPRASTLVTRLERAGDLGTGSPMGRIRSAGASRARLLGTNYLGWAQPGVLAGGATGSGQPVEPAAVPLVRNTVAGGADGSAEAASSARVSERTLESLVGEYVAAQRRSLLAAGWAAFKEGQYIRALELIRAADAASAEDPQERCAIKLAAVYASLAAGQLTQASLELGWLVDSEHYSPGVPRDPFVFNRLGVGAGVEVRDIRELYGTPADVRDHTQRIDLLLSQNPQAPEIRALKAVWMWGLGDRRGAIFEARQIRRGPRDVITFDRLPALLEAAVAQKQAPAQPSAAVNAPWPEFVESAMKRAGAASRPQ